MKCPRCGDDDIHGPACSCGYGPPNGAEPPAKYDLYRLSPDGPGFIGRFPDRPRAIADAIDFGPGFYSIEWGTGWAERCRVNVVDDGRTILFDPERPATTVEPTHSNMPRAEAIAEARRLGNPSPGDGWRRLLWRLADLLESRDNAP